MSNGCLSLLSFGLLGRAASSARPAADYPYGLRDDFLSPAEISFYHVLRGTLAADVTIVIKPRLSDILFVRQPHKNQSAHGRIDRRHVDFLLCETATMKPRLVIELDDSSHQQQKTQERDELVDRAMKAAGLPILHVRAAKGLCHRNCLLRFSRPSVTLPAHDSRPPSRNPATHGTE